MDIVADEQSDFFETFMDMYQRSEQMRDGIHNAGLFIIGLILKDIEKLKFERGLNEYMQEKLKLIVNPVFNKYGGFAAIKLLSMWAKEDAPRFDDSWGLTVAVDMVFVTCVGRIIYNLQSQRMLPESIVKIFNLKNEGSENSFSLRDVIDYNQRKMPGHWGAFNFILYFVNHLRGVELNAITIGLLWVNIIQFCCFL